LKNDVNSTINLFIQVIVKIFYPNTRNEMFGSQEL